ncbi:hypothetical protein BH18ACT3_BH18ACT3_27220 [soil metagenome]
MALSSTVDRLAVVDPGEGSPDAALRLRRSWPRGEGKLLVEYERSDGSTIAGQWYADPEQGAAVSAATRGSMWLRSRRLVLQPDGRDRRLPRLAGLVAEPGAALLVHGPERRAVVRRPGRRYAKVLPSRKAARVLSADRAARATGAIRMPELLSADVAAGILQWSEAPGRSLYEMLHDEAVPLTRLGAAAGAAGSSLLAMHLASLPQGVGHHGPQEEAEVAAFWMRGAMAHSAPPAGVEAAFTAAAAELSAATSPVVLIHRDLHEKQVLVDGEQATLLDLDTLAGGEAALDVANFLVHLELRAALGLPAERALAVAGGFLDAYRPSSAVIARIPAHAAMTRIRLGCLYAFRPRQADLAAQLVTNPSTDSLVTTALGCRAR